MKRPSRPKEASIAQAKKLAWLFQGDRYITRSESYVEPTDAVLIKRGWVDATGDGIHPSGQKFTKYKVNAEGLYALERYLWSSRLAASSLVSSQDGGSGR